MAKKRKRPITLLEVLIGCALTALLMTALFSSFRQTSKTQGQMALIRNTLLGEALTSQRLTQIFTHLTDKDFRYGSHSESGQFALSFTFDNGIDHDPLFCSEVMGFLYIDRQGRLCLSLKRGEYSRVEVIESGLSSLTVAFFDLKTKTWVHSWHKRELPLYLRLSLDSRTLSLSTSSPCKLVKLS